MIGKYSSFLMTLLNLQIQNRLLDNNFSLTFRDVGINSFSKLTFNKIVICSGIIYIVSV